jgi:hypothetical protein
MKYGDFADHRPVAGQESSASSSNPGGSGGSSSAGRWPAS